MRERGVSLVELCVVLSVVAVVMGPSACRGRRWWQTLAARDDCGNCV